MCDKRLKHTIFCDRIKTSRTRKTYRNIDFTIEREADGVKIIKRNGSEEVFDNQKIVRAVTKADTKAEHRSLTDAQIEDIAEFVEFKCSKSDYGDRSF